jgi:tRNA threonylcarbamoyladenosine biosynthesis protein TsaB
VKVLSLDSSSPVLSTAVVRFSAQSLDNTPEVLYRRDIPHARADSTALFQTLEEAMKACGSPEAVVVGLGPGSYNGLRASIAALRAMATSLAIPLNAVPSPLAIPIESPEFLVAGDARGGSFWVARVKEHAFLSEPSLIAPKELVTLRERNSSLPLCGHTELPGIGEMLALTPDAVLLAIVARKNDPFYLRDFTPEPLYLKPPHITEPRKTHVPA